MNIHHGPLVCLLAMLAAGCSPTSGENMPADERPEAALVEEMTGQAAVPARNAAEATIDEDMTGGRVASRPMADRGPAGAVKTDAEKTDGEADDTADAPIPPGPDSRLDSGPEQEPAAALVPAHRPDRIAPAPRDQTRPGPLDLPPSNAAAQDDAPFPDEVTTFMVDRDGCDHFRAEEPYDADRRAYLEDSIAQLCTGTDAKLAALRRRYSGNPAVIAALSAYEDRIEAPKER